MASAHRGPAPDLTGRLLREGPQFSFIQAMRLLTGARPGAEAELRFRPHLSMSFAEGDLAAVEPRADADGHLLTLHFLGLYGAGSPLPTFYTEDLLEEEREGRAGMRAFLDLLNAPFYPLRWRTWGRHRLFHGLVEAPSADSWERLFSLLGLGFGHARAAVPRPEGLLRHLGLFVQRCRSAEGLRCLLADRLGEPTLEVRSGCFQWLPVPPDQRLRLGAQAHELGVAAVLGERVPDWSGRFLLAAGPMPARRFFRWLPGAAGFREAAGLIRLYLDQPLRWDLQLTLAAGEARGARLGDPRWGVLGMSTWLLAGTGPAQVRFPDPGSRSWRLLDRPTLEGA